ncbi:LysR family transcriptional regulator [Peptoniphilus sp.]|uniref:LysR family transcriptional regulator n=1 Tax=Peptoniphilus sp. TaxID=1971214 RepID=UPI003D94F642
MELRNIITFLEVVKYNSFTKAANEVGYAQSTVTMQIQQIEEELNVKLFDRIGKSIYLTSYGEKFLVLAKEMYNLSLQMNYLNKDFSEMEGTLRVGTIESLFYSEMVHKFSQFIDKFPNVEIKIRTGSSFELYNELSKNNLDIVFGISDPGNKYSFDEIFTAKTDLVFITNKKYVDTINVDTFEDTLFVLTEEESYYNKKLRKLFADNGLTINKKIHIQNIFAIINFLEFNKGVAFLPKYVVKDHLEDSNFTILETNLPTINAEVSASINKEKWKSPFLNYYIKLIENIGYDI